MTTQSAVAPVSAEIIVDAPVERAFGVFTEQMGTWWPPDKHILSAELAEMVVEPYVGGGIIDRGVDGSECRWARILAFEPPHRFVFSWDINLRWEIEADPARCSEVEVRFLAEGEGRTRVQLRHDHLERHGDGWESMRAAVGSPNGWMDGLRSFAGRMAQV